MNPEFVVIEPVGVRKPTAARMLDCGLTSIYELIKQGKLRTFKVGDDDRVLVSSISGNMPRGRNDLAPARPRTRKRRPSRGRRE